MTSKYEVTRPKEIMKTENDLQNLELCNLWGNLENSKHLQNLELSVLRNLQCKYAS